MKKYFSLFKIAALCLGSLGFFNHCIIGGTGTDTPNGVKDDANAFNPETAKALSLKLVDSLGRGVSGVLITIADTSFRPDLEKKPKSVIVDSTKTLVTDSSGTVELDLVAGGVFVVTGSQQNSIVIFDTLKIINPKGAVLIRLAVKQSRAFQGRVRLNSGKRVDSGVVFIQGTEKIAMVDSTGYYDLGALPVDVAKMAIGLHYITSASLPRTITADVPDTSLKSPTVTDSTITVNFNAKCVENPGIHKTNFNVQFLDIGIVSDLLVSDVLNPCAQP